LPAAYRPLIRPSATFSSGAGEKGLSLIAAPGVVGGGDFLNIVVGEFAMNAVDESSQLAGVDEERFTSMIAEFTPGLTSGARLFILRQEPQAHRYLSAVE